MSAFTFHRGTTPLLISIPHAGTEVPLDIAQRMTSAGRGLPDTDWYVDELYEFARGLGASLLKASYSRYVVDLNRAPDSAPLYASSPTSPVCPLMTFGGEEIYRAGELPDDQEVAGRIERYWRPYHAQLHEELQRIRSERGIALLWDAHSIPSEVPGLFEGVLPEFNFGTRDDASCPAAIGDSLLRHMTADGKFGAVLNGRFKGGYITHHYGCPAERIYAVQLELAQRTYMRESPRGPYDTQTASAATRYIGRLLQQYVDSSL
jgi:N-formylglutamate deformylase